MRASDAASTPRDLVRSLVNAARNNPFQRCIYCGRHSYGKACLAHKDLLAVDPHGTLARSEQRGGMW